VALWSSPVAFLYGEKVTAETLVYIFYKCIYMIYDVTDMNIFIEYVH